MKTLIVLLMLTLSILAFGQDKPTPEQDEILIVEIEFDVRCMSPLQWSSSLIGARREGVTAQSIISKMARDYSSNGPLRQYRPETIQYMLSIVSTVFAAKAVDTPEEIISVLREVERICIAHLEDVQEQNKEEEIST